MTALGERRAEGDVSTPAPPQRRFERRRSSLLSAGELLVTLTQSDLHFRYGRGAWQVVRWLLDPFALVGVYLVLVAVVFDQAGTAPGLSIACAVVPFQLVMLSVGNAMGAVTQRLPIITNMAFRRTLIPLSSVLTESVAFAASFVVIALMMAIYAVPPTAALLWLPVAVLVTCVLAASLAFPASLYGLWWREMRQLGLSFMRILFFIGPGLVPLATIGEHAQWLKINPLTGVFETYRDIFLYGRSPDAWQVLYPLTFALLFLVIFVPLYRREQREFAKVAA